jgi:hypothetical protein
MTNEAPALRNFLAQNLYALSPEEKEELGTDMESAIPRLMGRLHVELSKNTLQLIESMVPKLIETTIAKTTASTKAKEKVLGEFYKANPALKPGEHDDAVQQYATTFRKMNPKASREEAFKFVGAAVMAHFGLHGAAPAPGANGKTQQPPPFQPARPGARQIASTPVDSQWSGLGEPMEDD